MKRFALILSLALWGCDASDSPLPTPKGPETSTPVAQPMPPGHPPIHTTPNDAPAASPVEVTTGDSEQVDLAPPYDAERRIVPRPRRRMNIDQLQASVLRVSGGINWTERRGRNEVVLFDELSATLGKPDFAETTDEELEATGCSSLGMPHEMYAPPIAADEAAGGVQRRRADWSPDFWCT